MTKEKINTYVAAHRSVLNFDEIESRNQGEGSFFFGQKLRLVDFGRTFGFSNTFLRPIYSSDDQ